MKKLSIVQKNFFFGMFPWTRRMQLRQPCRPSFTKSPNIFRSHSKKNYEKNMICSKNSFPSKCSSGHAKRSFDNPAGIFFIKRAKIFAPRSKKIINEYFFPIKNFSSKCSSGHVECSFENPTKFLLAKVRNFFAQIPKKFIK